MHPDADRIERSVLIDAPLDRVWQALADAETFGTWFGADLSGQAFVPGQRTRGPISHPGYEHLMFDVQVERVEPPRVLAFRWHPYAIDPAVDYSHETPTRVTFTLEPASGGATRLTVVESGFDQVPPQRRLEAFRMNGRGWDAQMSSIVRHVGAQAHRADHP
jgi:uncharacterized protein YndB with AHSA1/START domain